MKKQSKQIKPLFGLDLGMGACKLFGSTGGLQLPSHVATDNRQVVSRLVTGMRSKKPPMKVSVDGRDYYVGQGAHEWGRPIENLDYERLTGAPEMQAIFYGAFTRYQAEHGRIQQPVTLYVGLPLEPLSGEETAVKATLANVRSWLKGDHSWTADGEPFGLAVEEVKITSQPTGALFDYLLDDNGRFLAARKGHMKQEIGIVSVGFNTVELLAIQDLRPVQRFTAGSTSGVRRLLELINGEGLYSLGELDGQLRDGSLDTREALPVWAREVTGQIERVWGRQWKRFAQIVTVGGGAVLLNGQLTTRFSGKAYLPDDAVLAIARGLYKMALMQEAK